MEHRVYETKLKTDDEMGNQYFFKLVDSFKDNLIVSAVDMVNRKRVFLIEDCLVIASYYLQDNKTMYTRIYNAKNSLKKIRETKSLLEEKTGFKFKKSQ
ncbi:MAG: hypothetical protein WC915_06410 [archaeon]|jgi:SET domain-containing protein